MRKAPVIIAMALAACVGATPNEFIADPNAYLKAQRSSPLSVEDLARCIHGEWQSTRGGIISRAPRDQGVMLLVEFPSSAHKLAAMVDVQPAANGSVAKVYAYGHDEDSGIAVERCT